MPKDRTEIEIQSLDHVAIRVKDLDASIDWYHTVLGLKEYRLSEWGEYPLFMLSGKSGVALFPADLDDPPLDPHSKNVKIDHFAFNVTKNGFQKAKKRFVDLDLKFTEEDHFYFHSIYIEDPDGHTIELTTFVVDEDEFYQ